MLLTLTRRIMSLSFTAGDLAVDRRLCANTLELPWRNNEPRTSCIPAGTYRVRLSFSPRFLRTLPELLGVPGRSGIRMHPGNTVSDTSGCILVGVRALSPDKLFASKTTFALLIERLVAAEKTGEEIVMEILDKAV